MSPATTDADAGADVEAAAEVVPWAGVAGAEVPSETPASGFDGAVVGESVGCFVECASSARAYSSAVGGTGPRVPKFQYSSDLA